jgi:hypothetical protein
MGLHNLSPQSLMHSDYTVDHRSLINDRLGLFSHSVLECLKTRKKVLDKHSR